MAIWSLTQERVDKLLQQIGEKEQEIDTLIKLTAKDLWTRDLDDFIAEWRFQLEDEARRQKKVANYGRRASNKLKLGAKGPAAKRGKAKGGDEDDSDYGAAKPVKPKKAAAPKTVQPKPPSDFFNALNNGGTLPTSNALKASARPAKAAAQSKSAAARTNGFDGSSDPVEMPDEPVGPAAKKAEKAVTKKPAAAAAEKGVGTTADANWETKSPARKPRLATSKPISYGDGSESDSDDGDDMLGDVSKMVKGIGGGADSSTLGTKPLFAASAKVTSTAGVTKPKETTVYPPGILSVFNEEDDEYDVDKLAPKPVAAKVMAAEVTSNGHDQAQEISDHSEDEVAVFAPAPSKAVKPAAKITTAAAKAKKQPAANTKKPAATAKATKVAPTLSPAAKAYAAKQAAKKKGIESEDDESIKPAKPARGKAKSKDYVVKFFSEEDDSDVAMLDAPLPTRPAAAQPTTTTARPARRAAATATKQASKYVEMSSGSESESEGEQEESEDYSDDEE